MAPSEFASANVRGSSLLSRPADASEASAMTGAFATTRLASVGSPEARCRAKIGVGRVTKCSQQYAHPCLHSGNEGRSAHGRCCLSTSTSAIIATVSARRILRVMPISMRCMRLMPTLLSSCQHRYLHQLCNLCRHRYRTYLIRYHGNQKAMRILH